MKSFMQKSMQKRQRLGMARAVELLQEKYDKQSKQEQKVQNKKEKS